MPGRSSAVGNFLVMLTLAALLLSPLVGAFLLVRKPVQGFPYLAVTVIATLANGVAAEYYDLSPDGGAPERAWLPAGLAIIFGWLSGCILIAMFVRSLRPEVEAGTGVSPGQ